MSDFTETFVNEDTQSAESATYTELTTSSNCPSTSKRMDKLEAENLNLQTRLLTEIVTQRKISSGNRTRVLLPPKPFKNTDDIDKFESSLNNSSELCEQLEAEILNYNIADPSKFVRTILKKIFTDELATKYSWKGTNCKKCILSMTLTTTIRGAFNQKFSVDDKTFPTICGKWFQTASDRIKYYNKSVNKVNN
ncbi:uncharacterized protein LOC122320062 [Drosophila ficusphila]|uniref:uncharacterized protein LOC122320062 n=1 Tax=Drosophila ficusphila TaxID=30025 RepID=UPI001C88EE16|nr:uncharacterized protein LOC122320062 [Drosophila ficusphila]